MVTIKDFFIADNYVEYIEEDEYQRIYPLVQFLDAVARVTYQSFYVIDYYKQNFMFVSDDPLFLGGRKSQEVKDMGYSFFIKHVPEEELCMLLDVKKAGFAFSNSVSLEERLKLSMSYDFHIKNLDRKALYNHKLTPIQLDRKGKIWLALCVISPSMHKDAGNVEVRLQGTTGYWKYSLTDRLWVKKNNITLTKREKEVMSLSIQGYSLKEIADRLFIGIDAVKSHRKNLFEKLGVSKISEAITASYNFKMNS